MVRVLHMSHGLYTSSCLNIVCERILCSSLLWNYLSALHQVFVWLLRGSNADYSTFSDYWTVTHSLIHFDTGPIFISLPCYNQAAYRGYTLNEHTTWSKLLLHFFTTHSSACPSAGCGKAYLSTIPPYLFYRIGHSCHSEPEACRLKWRGGWTAKVRVQVEVAEESPPTRSAQA